MLLEELKRFSDIGTIIRARRFFPITGEKNPKYEREDPVF
jgi:hypothetical protein